MSHRTFVQLAGSLLAESPSLVPRRVNALVAFTLAIHHDSEGHIRVMGPITAEGLMTTNRIIDLHLLWNKTNDHLARVEMAFDREGLARYQVELVLRDEEYSHNFLCPGGSLWEGVDFQQALWTLGDTDPFRFGVHMAETLMTCGTYHMISSAGHEPKCQSCPNQLACLAGKTGTNLFPA